MEIRIFAVAAQGSGLSGSDRIFIEFARRWQALRRVTVYVNEEGRAMAKRQNLSAGRNLKYKVWDTRVWRKMGFIVAYFARIFRSIFEALILPVGNGRSTIIYSASEFWMDSLPALILKLRYPNTTWAAAWYQTAPNPFTGFSNGPRRDAYKLNALVYWLVQLPIKPLIAKFADFVLVNNGDEKRNFPNLNNRGRAIVVLGAVPLEEIQKYLTANQATTTDKTYDAVFQGRFHPQKGVIELVDIWKMVVKIRPNAKLVMIGDGPLMKKVRLAINNLKLKRNVILTGYVFDGDKKYKIFSQSKLVVHPAFFDSGGMASAEAMAFGLGAVGFNLKAYESYYPNGMVKVKTGDLPAFATAILDLLENSQKRLRLGSEAVAMIRKNWSWDKRAQEVLSQISLT